MARPTLASAAADVRLRFDSILNCPEAARNPEMAKKLAFGTVSVSEARDLLASTPPANPYLAALERESIGIAPAGATSTPFGNSPEERRAARAAELKTSMAAFNASRGYTVEEG